MTLVELMEGEQGMAIHDVVRSNVELLRERLPHFTHGEDWSITYFISHSGRIGYVGRYQGSDDAMRMRWDRWAVMRGVREEGRTIIRSMHLRGYAGPHADILEETRRRYNEMYGRAHDVESMQRSVDN